MTPRTGTPDGDTHTPNSESGRHYQRDRTPEWRHTDVKQRHTPVWDTRAAPGPAPVRDMYSLSTAGSRQKTARVHVANPELALTRSERSQNSTCNKYNRDGKQGDTPTREKTTRQTQIPKPEEKTKGGKYESIHAHTSRRARQGELTDTSRTDLRRLARNAMIRREHLDGERNKGYTHTQGCRRETNPSKRP